MISIQLTLEHLNKDDLYFDIGNNGRISMVQLEEIDVRKKTCRFLLLDKGGIMDPHECSLQSALDYSLTYCHLKRGVDFHKIISLN